MDKYFKESTKISIYYFSGTGNTQIISNRITEKLNELRFSAVSHKIEETESVSVNQNEILGIGFPIACFSTYPIVFDFLKKLPDVEGVPVFGFCTMAGLSLIGIIDEVRSILLRKGYTPIGFSKFRMPPNLFIKMPESLNRRQIEKGFQQADNFCCMLVDGRLNWSRKLPGSKLIFMLASALLKLTELQIHQKYLKIRIDHNTCNKCGLCVKKCPLHNITLDDSVTIGNKCQYCLRCVATCPQKATFAVLTPKNHHYRAENSNL